MMFTGNQQPEEKKSSLLGDIIKGAAEVTGVTMAAEALGLVPNSPSRKNAGRSSAAPTVREAAAAQGGNRMYQMPTPTPAQQLQPAP